MIVFPNLKQHKVRWNSLVMSLTSGRDADWCSLPNDWHRGQCGNALLPLYLGAQEIAGISLLAPPDNLNYTKTQQHSKT